MAAELADDVPDDLFPFPSPSASPLQILPHRLDDGGCIGPRHQETKGPRKEDAPSMMPSCTAPAWYVRHQGLRVLHGGRGHSRIL